MNKYFNNDVPNDHPKQRRGKTLFKLVFFIIHFFRIFNIHQIH